MICKNCKTEFDKGKFCSECGFPVEEKKKGGDRALEVLEKVEKRLAKLEEIETIRNQKLETLRKEKKTNGENDKGNPTVSRARSILDIF